MLININKFRDQNCHLEFSLKTYITLYAIQIIWQRITISILLFLCAFWLVNCQHIRQSRNLHYKLNFNLFKEKKQWITTAREIIVKLVKLSLVAKCCNVWKLFIIYSYDAIKMFVTFYNYFRHYERNEWNLRSFFTVLLL